MVNLLELFAWSRSVWNVWEKLGYNVFSTDLIKYDWINYDIDILNFDYKKVPFIPDIIWASPPCTTFSIAACWYHRKPWNITKEAILWDKIVKKTLEIIKYYEKINPNIKWYIENPRWLLRKMDFMQDLPIRHTVTYCSYWDIRMKPTDIWTNDINWKPLLKCHNYKYDKNWEIIDKHCHHESARRWSSTWTQWLKNAHVRSKIPEYLCFDILSNIKRFAIK